ncbi:MAG: hypothetical protein PHR53_01930 [Bacteroidales bacterium]|nr:hypothetical protein [Bacteroidales bacterium]
MSCRKKEKIISESSAKVEFSTDTVMFDTIFTTVGSSTRKLMVYNPHDETINISNIYLAGGSQSLYQINIDGYSTTQIRDVKILAKDSLYIFIKVRIDPLNSNNPLLVCDSLMFETNGNYQNIKLVAFGQDAHYFTPNTPADKPWYHPVEGVWHNDKPYLIYGYAAIDSAATLTIEAGCQIFFHKGGTLLVYTDGTLQVEGTADEKVVFRQDRTEPFYKDLPGQWNGILIYEGAVNNVINHAVIKNAVLGIQCDGSVNENPTLTLSNTEIKNMSVGGIGANGSSIVAENVLVSKCVEYAIALNGGQYQFLQTTVANQYSSTSTPSLIATNYFMDIINNEYVYVTYTPTTIFFGNSIVYGNSADELITDYSGDGDFTWYFQNSLLRSTKNLTDADHFVDCFNEDPKYINFAENDFHLDSLSPAIQRGFDFGVFSDIEGTPRRIPTDLGVYQSNWYRK